MKTNIKSKFLEKTHEGAPAKRANAEQLLRRSVLSCMLWEDEFYEDGVSIASRIHSLIPEVEPKKVALLAIDAREKFKLRHVPLWIVRAMAMLPRHKEFVADTLARVIQRPDELAEFVSLYWLTGRQPLSAQVKKGLARAFQKFSAYQLAKYNRDGNIKLRDVLFLCHAKPKDAEQEKDWKNLINGTLPIPNTWENRLSAGENEKLVWETMLAEGQLGALALLRNLRNMKDSKVDESIIFDALDKMNTERVLPFRFISAARFAPQWESKIEKAMLKCLNGARKLTGKTAILVDVSGSMRGQVSSKSDLTRLDAACGLAILSRELCDNVAIYSFSDKTVAIPDRRGFALRDSLVNSQKHSSTMLGQAVRDVNSAGFYDRIIVITDEQSHDVVPAPNGIGYMINVASYKNGVGYGSWTQINGWSEAVFDYIVEMEG